MCRPFPPLRDETVKLLIQLTQINISHLAVTSPQFMFPETNPPKFNNSFDDERVCLSKYFSKLPTREPLCLAIQQAFELLINFLDAKT